MQQKLLHFYLLLFLFHGNAWAQQDSVNMTSFNGTATEIGIDLCWTTVGEYNVESFLLERSLDAMEFKEVARVTPHVSNLEKKDYHYSDNHIYREHVYYRVTTILNSGTVCSNIIAVVRNDLDRPDIMVYPTITNQFINVVKNSDESLTGAHLRIFNLSGHLIMDKVIADNFLLETIDVSGYDAGAYVIELYKDKFASQSKFIKQNP